MTCQATYEAWCRACVGVTRHRAGRCSECEAVQASGAIPVRRAVEEIADAQQVSLSEVGRQAIAAYVKQTTQQTRLAP